MNSPTTKNDEIEGLVLSVQEYKENDGIIKLATPDSVVSFFARGIMKTTSKNRRLSHPFSKVRLIYEPRYSHQMYYLIHGSVLWYDGAINENLLYQSVCFVVRDLILRIGISPQIYELLEAMWHAFEENDSQEGMADACVIIAGLLKIAGFAPGVDACVQCGRTSSIETISVEAGGFVCRFCNNHHLPALPKQSLRKLRAVMRAKPENIPYLLEHFTFDVFDVLDLAKWYSYYTESALASLSFLKQIARLETKKDRRKAAAEDQAANAEDQTADEAHTESTERPDRS